MKFIALILFGIVLIACQSLPNIEKPNYCNSSTNRVSYHIYEVQSNEDEPTIHNSTIVGKSALGKNPFKTVRLDQWYNDYTNQSENDVFIELKDGLYKSLIDFSKDRIGKSIGIVANNKIIGVAQIQAVMGSNFRISFNEAKEAKALFEQLKFVNCQ